MALLALCVSQGCVCISPSEVTVVACEPSGECPSGTLCCADSFCRASCDQPTDAGSDDGGEGATDAGETADAGTSDAGDGDGGTPDAGTPEADGGTPVEIAIISAPVTAIAGRCSPAPVRVEVRDDRHVRANVQTAPLSIQVSSNPSGVSFFTDNACSVAAAGFFTIPVGAAEGQLYFGAGVARPSPTGVDLTFIAPSLPIGSNTDHQVQFIEPGPPHHFVWLPYGGPTSPVSQSTRPSQCSPEFTLEARDSQENPTSFTAPTTLTVTSAPAGLTFSPSASCGSGAIELQPGESLAHIFATGTVVQPYELTAAVGTVRSSAPAAVLTITTSAASQLAFASPASTTTAGACNAVTIESRDATGTAAKVGANTTVSLGTTAGAATFFTTPTCSGAPVTSFQLASGESQAVIGVRLSGVPTTTITASAFSGPSIASQSWSVTAGAAAKLVWHPGGTPSGTTTRFTCVPNLSVDVNDAFGNATTTSTARTLTLLSSASAAGVLFFSGGSCSGAPTTTVSVTAGDSTSQPFSMLLLGSGITMLTAADPTTGGLGSTPAVSLSVSGAPGSLSVSATTTQLEAFDCEPIVVTRNAGSVTWSTGASSLNASLPPGTTEVSLHTDNACTTSGASSLPLTIAHGASTVTFYAKGRSGASKVVTVSVGDLLSAFSSGTVQVTALPLVRRGACTIAANQSGGACLISPPLASTDLSHTFMLFQATGDQTGPSGGAVTCELTSSSTITCTRVSGGAQMSVTWQTVSYGRFVRNVGGVSVQHLSGVAVGGMGVATYDVALTQKASLSDSFLLFSSASAGTTINVNDFVTARLTASADAVRLTSPYDFTPGNPGNAITYSMQVVRFGGATVDRDSSPGPLSGTQFSVTGFSMLDATRTVLSYTLRFAVPSITDPAAICGRGWRGTVGMGNQLDFHRGNGGGGFGFSCTSVDGAELAYERIELPVGTSVNVCTAQISGSSTFATCSVSPVALDRTITWLGQQGPGGQAGGETDHSSDDNIGYLNATTTLLPSSTNQTDVRVERGASGFGGSTFTPMVVELPVP